MKNYLAIFISSLLSGFMITIGATVYIAMLAIGQKLSGAILFGFGLFIIIHLFFCINNLFISITMNLFGVKL